MNIPILSQEAHASEAKDLLCRSEPFMVKNALSHTHAIDINDISKQIGECKINVYISSDNVFPGGKGPYDKNKAKIINMRVNDLLDLVVRKDQKNNLLCEGEKYYAYQVPEEIIKSFFENYYVADLLKSTLLGSNRALWIGEDQNITPPHSDGWVNIIKHQLIGKKQIKLWSPECAKALKLNKFGDIHSRQSPIDVFSSFTSDVCDGCNYRYFDIIISPGDYLYIPEGWIHGVKSIGATVSVSHFFNINQEMRDAVFQLSKAMQTLSIGLKKHYSHLLGVSEGIVSLVDPAMWMGGD